MKIKNMEVVSVGKTPEAWIIIEENLEGVTLMNQEFKRTLNVDYETLFHPDNYVLCYCRKHTLSVIAALDRDGRHAGNTRRKMKGETFERMVKWMETIDTTTAEGEG